MTRLIQALIARLPWIRRDVQHLDTQGRRLRAVRIAGFEMDAQPSDPDLDEIHYLRAALPGWAVDSTPTAIRLVPPPNYREDARG